MRYPFVTPFLLIKSSYRFKNIPYIKMFQLYLLLLQLSFKNFYIKRSKDDKEKDLDFA